MYTIVAQAEFEAASEVSRNHSRSAREFEEALQGL